MHDNAVHDNAARLLAIEKRSGLLPLPDGVPPRAGDQQRRDADEQARGQRRSARLDARGRARQITEQPSKASAYRLAPVLHRRKSPVFLCLMAVAQSISDPNTLSSRRIGNSLSCRVTRSRSSAASISSRTQSL